MRKTNSTNYANERRILETCAMVYTLSLIEGRWKPTILWQLIKGPLRYSELRKAIPAVSERILVLQLRELETDGLVKRIVYAEVPPKVEYLLTAKGLSLKPILRAMSEWGKSHQTRSVRKSTPA